MLLLRLLLGPLIVHPSIFLLGGGHPLGHPAQPFELKDIVGEAARVLFHFSAGLRVWNPSIRCLGVDMVSGVHSGSQGFHLGGDVRFTPGVNWLLSVFVSTVGSGVVDIAA